MKISWCSPAPLVSLSILTYAMSLLTGVVGGYSIEKIILDSAPSPEMFDVFHVMPEGDVKVMAEFDLLLTLKQYKEMYMPEETARRKKRKAVRDVSTRWTNCKVFYEITDTITAEEDLKTIKDAMDEWTKYTCLTFEESTTENSRIQFKDGGGCYSQLGMQNEPQPVALARGCRVKGVVAHEIGHAIGWYHEHMRPDRDEYISVNLEVIPKRYQGNFEKYTNDVVNTYGVPYDYLSLMHYGSDAIPGSITTLDPDFQDEIGQRSGLTFKDIKLANLMYECAKNMGCPKTSGCPHNGFVFYKNYKGERGCQCWCDSGDNNDPLVLCSEIDREPPPPNPKPRTGSSVKKCYDVREDCKELSEKGHCKSKIELMMDACALTCDFCGKGEKVCMDHEKGCAIMAGSGGCKADGLQAIMERMCPASCGLCVKPPDPCQIQQELLSDIPGKGSHHSGSGMLSMLAILIFFLNVFLWN